MFKDSCGRTIRGLKFYLQRKPKYGIDFRKHTRYKFSISFTFCVTDIKMNSFEYFVVAENGAV